MLRFYPSNRDVQSAGLQWMLSKEVQTPWRDFEYRDQILKIPSLGCDIRLADIHEVTLLNRTQEQTVPKGDSLSVPFYRGLIQVKLTALGLNCPSLAENPVAITTCFTATCTLQRHSWEVQLPDANKRHQRRQQLIELYSQLAPPVRRNNIIRKRDNLLNGIPVTCDVVELHPREVKFQQRKKTFWGGLLGLMETFSCKYADVIVLWEGHEYMPTKVHLTFRGFPGAEIVFTSADETVEYYLIPPIVKYMTEKDISETSPGNSAAARLHTLADLLASGAISQQEYDAQRAAIIKDI